jgi:hypothetical protein
VDTIVNILVIADNFDMTKCHFAVSRAKTGIVHISSSVFHENSVVSVIVTVDVEIIFCGRDAVNIAYEHEDIKLIFEPKFFASSVDNVIDKASIIVFPSRRLLIEPWMASTFSDRFKDEARKRN